MDMAVCLSAVELPALLNPQWEHHTPREALGAKCMAEGERATMGRKRRRTCGTAARSRAANGGSPLPLLILRRVLERLLGDEAQASVIAIDRGRIPGGLGRGRGSGRSAAEQHSP